MLVEMAWRMWRSHDARLLWRMGVNMGLGSVLAIERFKRRRKRGEHFPPFVFLSVTNACNLNCQGCWVHKSSPPVAIPPTTLHRVIAESKRMGCRFFGILGGEPLLYPRLHAVLAAHRDCYFQVFTNGMLLDDDTASAFRRLGNVTPLISIEGLEQVSDERRGGSDVFRRTIDGLETARRHRLVTGVATSVCASNIDELATESFVRAVMARGVAYLWYYIYRPVGSDPHPELCLDVEQVRRLRRFIVEMRTRVPMMIVDAYWDDRGRGLCPAAVGISHHISPAGDVEPCPPLQFAADTIGDGRDFVAVLERSDFLERFRQSVSQRTRGCIILEDPDHLRRLVEDSGARDTSGRGVGTNELAAMCCRQSHDMPGAEIPERSWFYRLAKRNWFFGFGAYG
ncbi:MAG: radical SAM/SPASM domain-containing protein [Planctomycetota bacterium]